MKSLPDFKWTLLTLRDILFLHIWSTSISIPLKKNAVLKKFESDCHVKMASFISIIIIKKNETKKKDASPVGGITS